MKSGRKIFALMEPSDDFAVAIPKLRNGDLRSLIHYITTARRATPGTTGETILVIAMCEAVTRWMAKGKGKTL